MIFVWILSSTSAVTLSNGSVVGEIEFIIVFDLLSALHLYCCFIKNELIQHMREIFRADGLSLYALMSVITADSIS